VTAVELTRLRPEDSSLLFAWINDRALVTLNAPFRRVSPEEHDAWFEQIQQRADVRIFAIREDDRLVGSCQLHSIHRVHRSAELQIRVGAEDARGRGIGHEALQQLLRFGFDELDLHRIYLHVFATNNPAIRLYERAGFRREGVLREAALIEGVWTDILVMALLRHGRP
jgi:UDP-4-amino-4,6-dideoxy-N-acetyl-beta-L-altrosamine N-acetyltransferase